MAQPAFALNKSNIDNFQKLEIPVSGPGDINMLVVYSGTAILNWTRESGDSSSIDTVSLEITLEDDFGSLYDLPLAGDPPVATLPPVPTFLAVSSESSRTQAGFIGLTENTEWKFQIHPPDGQSEFTTLVTNQGGGIPKSALVIAANVTNDEGGSFNRISYQVSVAVVAKPPLRAAPTICGHLAEYQNPPNQPPFNLTLSHDPSQPNADPGILSPSSLEFIIDPPASNGANQLLTFTGEAIINFSPSNDDQLTRGTVAIEFLRDLGIPSNFINGSGSATFSSIYNNDLDKDTTYAVDCVQVAAGPVGSMIVPKLTAAVVVQGGAGTAITGLSRITYQANVEILVGLQILVSAYHPAGPPPSFAPHRDGGRRKPVDIPSYDTDTRSRSGVRGKRPSEPRYPDSWDCECTFTKHSLCLNSSVFKTGGTQQPGANPNNSDAGNYESHRAPDTAQRGLTMPALLGCSLPYPFLRTIMAFEENNPDVDDPTHLEVGLSAPNGANRLFIFTGAAKVVVSPVNDNQMHQGFAQIALDLDISPPLTRLIDASCYVGFAAFQNLEASNNTTYAIDCARRSDLLSL